MCIALPRAPESMPVRRVCPDRLPAWRPGSFIELTHEKIRRIVEFIPEELVQQEYLQDLANMLQSHDDDDDEEEDEGGIYAWL